MSTDLAIPVHDPNKRIVFTEAAVKAVNKGEREILHLISSPSVDRAGDVVEPSGADLSAYMKNPVVLANHDYRIESIIGKATSVEVNDEGLWARTKFRDTPLAKDAFNLAAEGIGGWSIGFRPIAHESMKDDKGVFRGFRFTKWEMLEYSSVAIPMNADIVNNAVQRGLLHEGNIALFFRAEQPKPTEVAPSEATVEVANPIDIHPALESVQAQLRRLARAEAARQLRDTAGDL